MDKYNNTAKCKGKYNSLNPDTKDATFKTWIMPRLKNQTNEHIPQN